MGANNGDGSAPAAADLMRAAKVDGFTTDASSALFGP
jgi:hypothetical protein